MVRGQTAFTIKIVILASMLAASTPAVAAANAPGGAYVQCDPHNPSAPVSRGRNLTPSRRSMRRLLPMTKSRLDIRRPSREPADTRNSRSRLTPFAVHEILPPGGIG